MGADDSMSLINTGINALGMFLTGGAANADPDASLGGAISSARFIGLGYLTSTPVPAARIDDVYPACGVGQAALFVDSDGNVVFTPPGGVSGTPVTIAAGASAIVSGQDRNKAVRVFRDSGFVLGGGDEPQLRFPMNGVLAHKDATNLQRQAGLTTYRAIGLTALAVFGVVEIRLWLPPVNGSQILYSIAAEDAIAGSIQSIASEQTAPTGLTFVSPVKEADALTIPVMEPGDQKGIWLRRNIPASSLVQARQDVNLAIKYKGA